MFYTDQIPELREIEQDEDGNYLDESGEVLPWYLSPMLQINISFTTTALSVFLSIVQSRLEAA